MAKKEVYKIGKLTEGNNNLINKLRSKYGELDICVPQDCTKTAEGHFSD